MRVLIVRSRAIDPSVKKIASALAKNGYNVHLLLWDRTGEQSDPNNDIYRTHFCRIKAPYDSLLAVFYLPLWWLFELGFLMKYSNKNTIIHACDFDTLWPAVCVKIIKRLPLNYSILDFYADNFPQSTPHFIRNIIAFAEKFGLRYTNTTFLADESRLVQIKGARYNNIAYIYNTPQEPNFCDEKKALPDSNKFVLFYAGVLHESRGLRQIIEAIEDIEDIIFLVAGTGPESSLFENLSNVERKKIKYIGWITYDEVIRQTILSDCIIALYDPRIPNNKYASPNKLFEAMMCRKPIIVNEGTSMTTIVQNEKCGLIVSFKNISQIKDAILTLENDINLCRLLGDHGREAYEKRYNWDIMQKRLVENYVTDRIEYNGR